MSTKTNDSRESIIMPLLDPQNQQAKSQKTNTNGSLNIARGPSPGVALNLSFSIFPVHLPNLANS